MSASNQIRTNCRLVLEVENHALNKKAEIWHWVFDRDEMHDGLCYSGEWEGRELEMRFQHLENGFLNVSVYQGAAGLVTVVGKVCDDHGMTIVAALGGDEVMNIRASC